MAKYSTLRLTLKINMDSSKEKAFVRAMLRRLNVLFAKCKPRGGLAELLDGNQLSDVYDGIREVVPKVTETKTQIFQFIKSIAPVLPETISERSMQPPEIFADSLDVDK